jgi:BolA protein
VDADDGLSRVDRIERRLRERLGPAHLELADESARHRGHPGATGGGGHFRAVVVSSAFDGKTRLERHRLVYGVLEGMFDEEIHALALETWTPAEWGER